jgi:hypothetical protein
MGSIGIRYRGHFYWGKEGDISNEARQRAGIPLDGFEFIPYTCLFPDRIADQEPERKLEVLVRQRMLQTDTSILRRGLFSESRPLTV